MHLGSPILSAEPYRQGIEKGLKLIDALRKQGHPIEYLNMGGGFGIHYRKQEALPGQRFRRSDRAGRQTGRVQARSGTGAVHRRQCRAFCVSRVIFTKESGGKHYIIQDAAMNDLIRPTLYDSFHRIWPVAPVAGSPAPPDDYETEMPNTLRAERRRTGLRVGRLSGQGPPAAPSEAGRFAGGLQRRRLRHGDEFQLQQPAAGRRSPRYRR